MGIVEMTAADPPGDLIEPAATAPSFETFYAAEYSKLVHLGYVLTGSRSLAEELAQETMLRAFRHWDRADTLDRPGAWTRRILINLATSRGRRLAVEARAMVRLRGDRRAEPAPSAATAALWDAVRSLPRREAQAIALHYLEDMSIADIAIVLNAPENTVKAMLRRGRLRLAERLGEDEDA